MYKWFVALLLISPRLMACDCAEATVLWIDHANQRYYVSLDEATRLSIQAKVYDLVGVIQTEQPTWLGHVRIGFLAEGSTAEPHTPKSTDYLADYDQATSTLTWDPGSENPQPVEVFVSIPVLP